MSRDASVRSVLDAIGSAPAPQPRHAFVNDLEVRLASLIATSAEGDVVPEVELAPPAAPLASRRVAVGAAAALCALSAVVGLSLTRQAAVPSQDLATAGRAVDAERDRRPERDVAGGDIDVTAGLEEAADGADNATPSSTTRETSTPTTGRQSTTATTGSVPGIATDSSTSAATTQATSAQSATDEAATTGRPPATLGLTATGTAARVFLSWARYDGDDFAAYLVLRAANPDSPEHPDASGRTLMLLRIENRDMTSHQDTPKVGTNPRYRVVVVRKDGTVAARSAAVAPTMALTPANSELFLGGR